VRQIGLSLAAVMKADPPRAFLDAADARVGAILDVTEAQRRQEVLSGLEESDSDFAARVRRAIFTFADIPDRVAPKDVPALIRNVDRDRLLQVIAGADDDSRASVDFLLEAMSQRMAAALRADAADLGGIDPAVAEAARRAVTEAMRAQMEDGG
jgi:flagellar motor switch protein FliG